MHHGRYYGTFSTPVSFANAESECQAQKSQISSLHQTSNVAEGLLQAFRDNDLSSIWLGLTKVPSVSSCFDDACNGQLKWSLTGQSFNWTETSSILGISSVHFDVNSDSGVLVHAENGDLTIQGAQATDLHGYICQSLCEKATFCNPQQLREESANLSRNKKHYLRFPEETSVK